MELTPWLLFILTLLLGVIAYLLKGWRDHVEKVLESLVESQNKISVLLTRATDAAAHNEHRWKRQEEINESVVGSLNRIHEQLVMLAKSSGDEKRK